MGDIILRVENVSKQYRLGSFGTNTIGGDVHRWWTTKIRGKEDPFLKVGDVNDRTSKVKSDFVWALKDIDFEVKRGEVLGIIGKNGAGKSTLLKLLSRITKPTTGSIESWGRMASLLEVGTGFHPELTGRENIFLNGAILGMSKQEIKRKLDEIIDFSGCALYIDTPVKRYSSGMTVRLGFAVAAFLDPEILIVDEVLAVGDAEFQKKAIGKMQDISKGEGRTVLVVSHNMESVQHLCQTCIALENGQIINQGETRLVINKYLNRDANDEKQIKDIRGLYGVDLISFSVVDKNGSGVISNNDSFEIDIFLNLNHDLEKFVVALNIYSIYETPLVRLTYNDFNDFEGLNKGKHRITFKVTPFNFAVGKYIIELDVAIPNVKKVFEDVKISFEIISESEVGNKYFSINSNRHNSILRPNWLKSINTYE
jgi:lipopolysaccharide transport system ATP-binding protein